MKYAVEVRRSPTGELVPFASVRVRDLATGTTVTTLTADADGLVTYVADGHIAPFYLQTTQTTGSPRFWSSRDHITSGPLSPAEIPVALTILGNSVIRGYEGELAAVLDGVTVTMDDGGALVYGYPIINYTQDIFTLSRPVASTRIDRIIARVYPYGSATTEGKAEFVVLAGVEGGSAPSLTNSSTVQEATLWKVTVPTAGALTLTDERTFAGETPPITGITRSDAQTTTNASGEILTNLNASLVLVRNGVHDIEAWVSAIHDHGGGWVLQATYGSFGAGTSPLQLNTPGQVASDSGDNIYIADAGNNRIVKLNSSGVYQASKGFLNGIGGLAINGTDIWFSKSSGGTASVYKTTTALVDPTLLRTEAATWRHCATDGTYVFYTDSAHNAVYRYVIATDSGATFGSSGSGNGQFSSPYGICYYNSEVYVVDAGNSRVQVFNTSGVYQRQWAISASARGIAPDASSHLLVAEYGSNIVKRYSTTGTLIDSFSQATPEGIAVATGDVVWVSNAGSHNIAKWDEAAAGYGGIAIEIDGNLGSYITLGDLTAMLQNSYTHTATGPATISVKVYGKATSGTATFRSVVLAASAKPRS